MCPRKRFQEDLITQLKHWQEDGYWLIVCLDTNKNIFNKSIVRTLTDWDGISMSEVVGDFTCQKFGATYFRGSNRTSDITVVGACIMPVWYGVEDHRLFIIDYLISCLVGTSPPSIVWLASRRLNSRKAASSEDCSDIFEHLVLEHKLIERLVKAHESRSIAQIVKENINKIDIKSKQYMAHAEK